MSRPKRKATLGVAGKSAVRQSGAVPRSRTVDGGVLLGPSATTPNVVGAIESSTARVGRRELVRFAELPAALVEAHIVSLDSQKRFVWVLSLAHYFDGERTGFVVIEGKAARGRELSACVCCLAAL